MTAPRFALCQCGHGKPDHEALAPQCTAAACSCLRYRPTGPASAPRPTPPTSRPKEPAMPGVIETLLDESRKSSNPKIVKLAEKITAHVTDLRTMVNEYAEQAEAREEVERLQAELAAARAKLTSPLRRTRAADQTCPDCGNNFANLGVHRSRAHGHKATA